MKQVIQLSNKDEFLSIKILQVSDDPLELSFIKSHIGLSDGKSYIELVYKLFPEMPQINLIVDEEGLLKNLTPTIITPTHFLVGDILICSTNYNSEGEADLCGMTPNETKFALLCIQPFIP